MGAEVQGARTAGRVGGDASAIPPAPELTGAEQPARVGSEREDGNAGET